MWIHEVKKPNSAFYAIVKSEESYNKMKDNLKGTAIKRDEAKKYLYDFLKEKSIFKNKIIQVSYVTDEGMVHVNKTLTCESDKLTKDQVTSLMVDPVTNNDMASGEYNNELAGKSLYGVTLTLVSDKPVKPVKTTDKRKYNPDYNISF